MLCNTLVTHIGMLVEYISCPDIKLSWKQVETKTTWFMAAPGPVVNRDRSKPHAFMSITWNVRRFVRVLCLCRFASCVCNCA